MAHCVQCERLISVALSASRAYYDLMADLERAQIIHNTETPLHVAEDVEKAEHQRAAAMAELVAHKSSHKSEKRRELSRASLP